MKVWLDDIREAPEGWTRCLRPDEVIELLERGRVEEISLDYDLGLVEEPGIDWNGEDVLRWIERQVVEHGSSFFLPAVSVHTANPVGRQRLQRALDAIERRAADV
jgi:NAD+-processing family protein with receiver domain